MKTFIIKYKKKKWLLFLAVVSIFYLIIPVPIIENPTSTILFSNEGFLLGAKIAKDGQWRFPGLDRVTPKMEACLLLFEDEYFYKHPGFNPISIFRAISQNIKAGKIVSGGSTITMQLLRIARENKSRNYFQKIIEIILSTKYELKFSKQEILKKYLDNAPFGGNVVGLEAAAWRYYARSPFQLSWAENATLAVLPNAPSLIYPGKGQEILLQKRNRLLKKLLERGNIDTISYELSLMEPIPEKPHNLPRVAPHLLEKIAYHSNDKRFHSSIQFQTQKKVSEIINQHHQVLTHNQIFNAAALVVDNRTRKVIAYVGNTLNISPEHGSDVDIITAPRSTGSILKPFLFAAMLTDGELLPNMLVADIPTQIQGFSPKNFNLTYDGAVPAKKALSRSLNIPAVRMLQDYGIEKFLAYLKKIGLTDISKNADHYGLSLILGGAETSLWDLVSAYSNMANIANNYPNNSGKYRSTDWQKINFDNRTFEENVHLSDEYEVYSASAIYSTFKALLEVNRPDTEAGWEMFGSSQNIAWKTGTSYGYRDAWAIGITPEYTVGVWVGNADGEGRPGLTGGTVAAPILFDIYNSLPNTTWFEEPYNDMVRLKVCKESGYPASTYCDHVETIWVADQINKTSVCPFHKIIHLDSLGMYQVNSDCYPQQFMKHKSWFVLPPSWEWYYRRKNPFYKKLPPFNPNCLGTNTIDMMEFLYPTESTNIYVPRDINGTLSEVVFKIVHREPRTKVFWHLDDKFIGSTEHFHEKGIQPSLGHHTMTVVDELGNSISKKFFIVDRNPL